MHLFRLLSSADDIFPLKHFQLQNIELSLMTGNRVKIRYHENSTHENSTQRKFHPRKIPPNNRLKGGVYLT